MRISDWSSDVCSSDLLLRAALAAGDFVQAQALFDMVPLEPAQRDALLLACIDDAPSEVVGWLLAHGAQADRAHGVQGSVLFSLLARGEAGAPGLRRLLCCGFSPAGAAGLARFPIGRASGRGTVCE